MSLSPAEKYLIKADKKLGALIKSQSHIDLRPDTDYFQSLASSIVSQQISVKAADSIFRRLVTATELDPEKILALSPEEVKAIGLSNQKNSYLRNLSNHFLASPEIYQNLESYDDETVIRELTAVKGIGIWTAQMFLIFTLARPDIFAPDDRGLQMAVERLYGYDQPLKRSELLAIAEPWMPYRSTASLHLWQSRHNKPIV